MSAAPAPAKADEAPKKGGKKKLIIILAAVLLLGGGGGGGYVFYAKQQAAKAAAEAAENDDGDEAPKKAAKKHADKKGSAPVFLPLDPFVVNLADEQTERYLQLGITLEVDEAKTGDTIKSYMPVIRNNILMLVAHKTALDLQNAEGKLKLAREIQRAALQPMGIEVEDDDEDDEDDSNKKKKKKKKKKRVAEVYPVVAVHFSSFIIQ